MKTKERLEGGWGVITQGLVGAILIGAVIAVPTALYFKFETRTEQNSLRLVTMRPEKKLEDLKSYNGAKIVGYFDGYSVIKLENGDRFIYLNLSPNYYAAAKTMEKLDTEVLARLETPWLFQK